MRNQINQLIANIEFWWAKRTIKFDRDFTIFPDVDKPNIKEPTIEILRGKFTGIRFKYSNISVKNEVESLLEFHTVVVYNPLNIHVFNEEFENLTSKILRIILLESIKTSIKELDQETINENRTTDTVEFDEGREFHEEKSSLLEKRISKRKPRKKAISGNTAIHPEIQPTSKPNSNKTSTSRKNKSNRK